MSDNTNPDVVELPGPNGTIYKAQMLSPFAIRRFKQRIREQRIAAYLAAALKALGSNHVSCPKCSHGFTPHLGISDAERIKTVAVISAQPIDQKEMFQDADSLEGQIFLLSQSLLPFHPDMTEDAVERVFGPVVAETMDLLEKESGLTTVESGGDSKDADPITTSKSTLTESLP